MNESKVCRACRESKALDAFTVAGNGRKTTCDACLNAQDEARFWEKVQIGDPGVCWPWSACRDQHGYGQMGLSRPRRRTRAYRIAWELVRGAVPVGAHVLHRCDNPPCCNPGHLFLGTHRDNMLDKIAKGRHQRGSKNPFALISEEDVPVIRGMLAAGLSAPEIARRLGITARVVRGIRDGSRWRHVA